MKTKKPRQPKNKQQEQRKTTLIQKGINKLTQDQSQAMDDLISQEFNNLTQQQKQMQNQTNALMKEISQGREKRLRGWVASEELKIKQSRVKGKKQPVMFNVSTDEMKIRQSRVTKVKVIYNRTLEELYECRDLLREIVMRGNYLFPETEQDAKMSEERFRDSDRERLIFNAIRLLHLGKKGDGKYGED